MDINPNSLSHTQEVLSHLHTDIMIRDIFESAPSMSEKFDSISMNYLLHCLPGSMEDKSVAIKNAANMLKEDGILFGATIISDENRQTYLSRALMRFYTSKGIFGNNEDRVSKLHNELDRYLKEVSIEVVGCVALFKGIKK